MKTFKEYPATHSMATSWYVADEDGNVGIIDFEDNGPVPWETEQTIIEDLVFGHEEGDKFIRVNLTDDQIFDLLQDPHSPEEEEFWYDCFVQIDKTQEEEFLHLAHSKDIDCHVISEKLGLYKIDAGDCFPNVDKWTIKTVIKDSSLGKMLGKNMILRIYHMKDYTVSGEWHNDKLVYEHEFDSAPYFIYGQPYWPKLLAERINIPADPVKISQFPEKLQKRIYRLPVKFSECEKIQIAEWVPCSVYTEEEIAIDGCGYSVLPLSDGSKAYVLTDINATDFFKYCSEREKHHCKQCTADECYYCDNYSTFTARPTVMMIIYPFRYKDYDRRYITDEITMHSIILPYLPKVPCPPPHNHIFLNSDARKMVSLKELHRIFKDSHRYMDDMLRRYRPRVIIIGEDAYDALSQVYQMADHVLLSDGEEFPYYMEKEVEAHRGEIERLAQLPYQGKVFPQIANKALLEKNHDDE